jgi:hypothetical protein
MKWQVTIFGIAVALIGCGDLDHCPGASVCGRGDNFSTNSKCLCSCTAEQNENEDHMCCKLGPQCNEASDTPPPECGMTPARTPAVNVMELMAFATLDQDQFIGACEPFTVHFLYVNPMNGPLLPPAEYNPQLPTPMLVITEVGGGAATMPPPREVAWSELAACAPPETKNEEYEEGINPNNASHTALVAIEIALLPTTASGVTTIQKDIGQNQTSCL